MNGRAELSTSTLGAIILTVVGFVLLAVVLASLYTRGDIDKEVCHESVILRATTGGFANIPSFVPLNCVTEKSCITSGLAGGNCKEDFENTKDVKKEKVSDIEDIEKLLADKVADCWTVMGQGKVSLFDNFLAENYGIGKVYSTCVICSRIAFDAEALAKKKIDLSEVDVTSYMLSHKVPGKEISYYEFLGGGDSGASFSEGNWTSETEGKEGEDLEKAKEYADAYKKKLKDGLTDVVLEETTEEILVGSERVVLFMQITAPTYSGVWKTTLATLGATVFGAKTLGAGNLIPKGPLFSSAKYIGFRREAAKITGKGKVAIVVGAVALIAAAAQTINVYKNKGITAGYCGDISTGDNAREGCSVVRLVDYNLTQIKQYCSVVESKNN